MNYSVFIIKVIQSPEQSFFEDETTVTEMLIKFPQFLNKNYSDIFQISVWGALANDAAQYYNINDYLIVEGHLSLRENPLDNLSIKKDKQIEFTVTKLYPFLLNNQNFNNSKDQQELPF